ncbi:hypothetical protein H1D32_10025 [Anaerobacillus sp. CMMVII]|uniref:hypothetical protein n=1 Tax=Anaerobacillus sp. CMMVII TaxID=2755588 RepID=UPI0021B79451|nr:hypothetical protein [Anaerobacillus sp. CMMVII]MCT8138065.1 hypothetical protein [Anaerobacillus sp. CMMVII]
MSWFLEDTKSQIYFDELLNRYLPNSRISQSIWKNLKPFLFGEEKIWQQEIDQLSLIIENMKRNQNLLADLDQLFKQFEDIRSILEKLSLNWDEVDPLLDFFHIKQFLWFSYTLSQKLLTLDIDDKIMQTTSWYKTVQKPWVTWLQLLHPNNKNFYPNFALQDIDHRSLKDLRAEKRRLVREKRESEKLHRSYYETKLNIKINYEGYVLLSISNSLLSSISSDPHFTFIREQGNEFVYYLLPSKQERIIDEEIKN